MKITLLQLRRGSLFALVVACSPFPCTLSHAQTSPFLLNGNATPNVTVVTANGPNDHVTTVTGSFNPSSAFSDTGSNTTVTIGSNTQITITSPNFGITLESGLVDNSGNVTVTNSSETAVVFIGAPAKVTNETNATLMGGRNGVAFSAGGTLVNSGTITGTNADGVFVQNGAATITNKSGDTIHGGFNGLDLEEGATVTNAGTLSGGNTGILVLNGAGTVTNSSTGVITGSIGISFNDGGLVTNAGQITGSGTGIMILANMGTVTNKATGIITATSFGGFAVDFIHGGAVTNAGQINGSVFSTGGTGTVVNASTGTITGTDPIDFVSGGSVSNAGQINGLVFITGGTGTVVNMAGATMTSGVGLLSSGSLTNSGTISGNEGAGYAVFAENGMIVNRSTGIINGTSGGIFLNGGGTLTNHGTITSAGATSFGVFMQGGTVMNYGSIASQATGAFNGLFFGSSGATFNNYGGSVTTNGATYAVQFSGANNTMTVGNFSNFNGTLFGGNATNDILNFNFLGGNLSAVQTGTPTNGSLTIGGITYTYQEFSNVNVTTSSFSSLGGTPNERAIGNGLDGATNQAWTSGNTNPGFKTLYTALFNIQTTDPAAFDSALDELSPEKFAAFTSSTAFNNASFDTLAMDNYLNGLRTGPDGTFVGGNGSIDASGLSVSDPSYDPNLALVHSRMLAWNPSPANGMISDSVNPLVAGVDAKDIKSVVPQGPGNPWDVFVRGNVILAQGLSQTDIPHFDANTESVVLGADYRFTPNFLFGLTAGYAHTDATLDDDGSSATVDSYSPGIYASYAEKGWYANFSGDYNHNAYTQARRIAFLAQTANSAPEGNQGTVNLDGGYDFHEGALTVGPLAGLQYNHLTVDGFNETGSVADLTVDEQQSDSLRGRLGGRLSYAFFGGGMTFTPHLDASWQHEFLDQNRGITSQFTGFGGGSFNVQTNNPSRDSALVDAGLDADINSTVGVFVDYTVQAGQANYFGQSVQAGVKIGF